MHEFDSARPVSGTVARFGAPAYFGAMTKKLQRYLPDIDSIARYLGCSRRTVQRLVKNKGLPALSSGRNRVAALPERIDAWRAQRDKDSAP